MSAFQQFPASFLMDSVFLPNMLAIKAPSFDEFTPNLNQFYSSSENCHQPMISYNQEGSSIDAVSAHESSCLEQQSVNEPSSAAEKQRNDSLSMVENAENGEQVIQSCVPAEKKRKSRKRSSSNSANSKVKQVKCKKQKGKKEAVKDEKNENQSTEDPPKGYIHVRARRGQATDSHSLAERVRREKISERMKMLQALVPGCDKVTGKAMMLDEIINYVQSLQNQVEFLSLKLASVDPTVYTFGLMDHDPMLFATQAMNNVNMTLPLPMPQMQPIINGSGGMDQPQALANTNGLSCSTAASSAPTLTFPAPIVDSSASLFQQELKPSLLPLQDAGSLYWGVNEEQRQSITSQFGFSNTNNFYSLQ